MMNNERTEKRAQLRFGATTVGAIVFYASLKSPREKALIVRLFHELFDLLFIHILHC